MKVIGAVIVVTFLIVSGGQSLSFTNTNSDSMIAGAPSQPLPGREEGAQDDYEEDSGEYDESEDHGDDGSSDKSEANDSDEFEDWYEPDPAYQ